MGARASRSCFALVFLLWQKTRGTGHERDARASGESVKVERFYINKFFISFHLKIITV